MLLCATAFLMDHNLQVLFWNVHGLNCPAKRAAVRSVITSVRPSVVCLQETKLALVSSSIVTDTLGSEFSDFFALPADGTRGGIILAWRSAIIALSNPPCGRLPRLSLCHLSGR